jgi:hypothetical protein
MRRVACFDSAIEHFATGSLDPAWFASLPALSATLIRRRIFERVRFTSHFPLAEDIDFFLRAKRFGAVFQHGNTCLARVRRHCVDKALRRIKAYGRLFLAEASNRDSVETLCFALNQQLCDPLLDAWGRVGVLRLALKLAHHRSVARYAGVRAWRRLRYLGIRGILLRQLLWLKARGGWRRRAALR